MSIMLVFAHLFVLTNIIAVIVGYYWVLFDPVPNLTISEEIWRNANGETTNQFHAGEIAYLSRIACADKAAQTSQGRSLRSVDGMFAVPLESGVSDIKPGCITYTIGTPIAASIPPRQYQYIVNLQMTFNPLRTVTIVLKSPPIEVMRSN